MKAFIDTDVLVDLVLQQEDPCNEAACIKAMGYFNDVEIWASSKSFADVLFMVQQHLGSEAVKQLATNSRTYLYLCSITEENVFEAARGGWADFETCLVNIAAEKIKADVVVTRNAAAFEQSFIPVMTPEQFIKTVELDLGVTYEELFE